MVPEGGFDSNSLTKNGAASALPKNDRRVVFTGSFYFRTKIAGGRRTAWPCPTQKCLTYFLKIRIYGLE
jgi:hypothetical protein